MGHIHFALAISCVLVAVPAAAAAPTFGMGKTATGGGHGGGGGAPVGSGPGTRWQDPAASAPSVVMGSLEKELIRSTIHRKRQQLVYCIESRRSAKPELAGKLVVGFVIAADGRVQSAEVVTNDTHDELLGKCVAERFRTWTFPAPKGGGVVQVNYPVVFAPEPAPSR